MVFNEAQNEVKFACVDAIEQELDRARERLARWQEDELEGKNGMAGAWVSHYKSFISGLERARMCVNGVNEIK